VDGWLRLSKELSLGSLEAVRASLRSHDGGPKESRSNPTRSLASLSHSRKSESKRSRQPSIDARPSSCLWSSPSGHYIGPAWHVMLEISALRRRLLSRNAARTHLLAWRSKPSTDPAK
jgi:hypothetical protein